MEREKYMMVLRRTNVNSVIVLQILVFQHDLLLFFDYCSHGCWMKSKQLYIKGLWTRAIT